MIGNFYHAGINLKSDGRGGWSASTSFIDAGFVSDDTVFQHISTEGSIRTRYYVKDTAGVSGLQAAVRAIHQDLEYLGIDVAAEICKVVSFDEEMQPEGFTISEEDKENIRLIAAEIGYEVASLAVNSQR